MILRKSFLYKIIWIVYSILAIGFSALVFTKAANLLGKDEGLGLLMVLPALVLMNLGVFFSEKLRTKLRGEHRVPQNEQEEKKGSPIYVIIKYALPIVILVCGILLRVNAYKASAYSLGSFYDAVKIDGSRLYMPLHAATGIYYNFLRGVLYLFGNHPHTLVVFQIVAQLISSILLYVAASRLTGRLQSNIMFAFLMCSPYSVKLCLELSPLFVYLSFTAITFIVISFCTKNNIYSIILAAASGMFAGELIMMDISGLIFIPGILLLFYIGKKNADNKNSEKFSNADAYSRNNNISELQDKVVLLIAFYTFLIVGIVFITICYLVSTGDSFSSIISQNFGQYKLSVFSLYSLRENIDITTGIIVSALLLMGIYGGLRRKDSGSKTVYVIIICLLIFLCGSGMIFGNMHGEYMIFIFLCILAGESVYDVTLSELSLVTVGAKAAAEAESEEELKHTVHRLVEVELLDNPLPIPEKKKKKKLEYDYYVPDEADYDL